MIVMLSRLIFTSAIFLTVIFPILLTQANAQ